jgi:hypothetical protein
VLNCKQFTSAEYLEPASRGIEYAADPREGVRTTSPQRNEKKATVGRYWDEFTKSYSNVPMAPRRPGFATEEKPLFRFDTLDKMFDLLSALGLVTDRSCREICESLAGSYFAYRYSSRQNVAFKSHVVVHKYIFIARHRST